MTNWDRRVFLRGVGTAAAASLAGCSALLDGPESDLPSTHSDPAPTATDEPTPTEEPTDTEPDTGVVNFQSANGQPLPDTPIFEDKSEKHEQVIDYSLDLGAARQRGNDIDYWDEKYEGALTVLIENLDDEEWRRDVLDEAEKIYDQEFEDTFNYDILADTSRSFAERYRESNFNRFWHAFSKVYMGSFDSTLNEEQAAVVQSLEWDKFETDNIVWAHQTPGHGFISFIENPTYDEENYDEQRTGWMETVPTDGKEVAYLSEEVPGGYPTQNDQVDVDSVYAKTVGNTDTVLEAEFQTDPDLVNTFEEFLLNPAEHSGQELYDIEAVTQHLGDDPQFSDSTIYHSRDRIQIG